MGKLSLISILGVLFVVGCGTKEKNDSIITSDHTNCQVEFVSSYESLETRISGAYEKGVGDIKTADIKTERDVVEQCRIFKTTYESISCKAQDQGGQEVEMKSEDLNEECESFNEAIRPEPITTEDDSSVTVLE